MFGLLKSKSICVSAPVDGEVVELGDVPDEVFSKKLAGEGLAIIPSSEIFCAPIDGKIVNIFATNHAFIIKNGRFEVIVHIGRETVELQGEGFTRVANIGDAVKAGDSIIKADLEYIAKSGKSTITPIVVYSDILETKKTGIEKQNDLIMEVK